MPLTQPAIRLLAITTLAPLTVVALTAGLGSAAPATRPATTVPVGVAFFTQRIAPVLKEQCYPCHHADTPVSSYKGGLLLDNLAGMLKGGDSKEPAIVPGHPDKGTLMPAIRYTYKDEGKSKKQNMPPKWGKDHALGGKLPDQTVRDFEEWIRMGAPVPEDFKESKVEGL